MKKALLLLQLICCTGVCRLAAQNMYPINSAWLDLETLAKTDNAPEHADSVSFKKASKYANRFNVVSLMGDVPKEVTYKGRPFKVVDATHMGYRIPPATKDVVFEINKDDEQLDDVPGNDFLVVVPDGIVHVQRFEGKLGYRVCRMDEWGKTKFRQNIPHTAFTTMKGTDQEFKTPYLLYFNHTDRFMAFTSLNTHGIHKTVIVDLKDGKTLPIESAICGVIRAENDIAYKGYIIRDEAAKTMQVSMPGSNWALKDNNISKLIVESVISDSLLILGRYHQGAVGISLIAFNAKTGKPVWNAELKQPGAAVNGMYLSMYKNKLMMEVAQSGGNNLEVFDMNNGKRLFSTL